MKPDIKDAYRVARCLNLYWYNSYPLSIVEALFPTADKTYINEKTEWWNKGLTYFMGALDEAHQMQFVQMALDKYWEESGRYL